MPKTIYAIATMDTKGDELAFVAERIAQAGVRAEMVDVGTQKPPTRKPDIDRETIAACYPDGAKAVLSNTDRGQAIVAMSLALTEFLKKQYAEGRVAGVIGLGGTGGTALIAPAMRALPIGLPKMIVSTIGGGNVSAYVGNSDLIMVPSIVDVAGLNSVSRKVLANAAHAIAGMVGHTYAVRDDRPAIGMTMFGVTTPCVEMVRQALEKEGFDCLVFHATGTGGRAMEKLVEAGLLKGILDITTTEVADEVVGGVFPSGPERFDAILKAKVPYVVSLGALDMVNFGAKETVPEQFRNRKLHVHNAQVTLMRTTADENRQFAKWIAAKFNRSISSLTILIPEGGVSAIDATGQPFHDPAADAALFETLEANLVQTPQRVIRHLPNHINDRPFADELVRTFLQQWSAKS